MGIMYTDNVLFGYNIGNISVTDCYKV